MDEPMGDLVHAKRGAAILAACFVRTLGETDKTFQNRFLKNLDKAHTMVRDGHFDGDVTHEMELLMWTSSMLTGWDLITGPGKPFFQD